MATFAITSILLIYFLIPFGNAIYLPNGKYGIPNEGNQLRESAGGSWPSATSTIQNSPRDSPYYVPRNPRPDYEKGITGSDAGALPYPNKYAVNPSEPRSKYPSITVNSVNNAVSTSSNQPSSNQLAELDNYLDSL